MSLLQATRPLEPWRWLGWPAILCLLATMLLAAPVRLFGLPLPQPVFPMLLAYAWALIRPSILAPFALLLIGLFLDIFWGDTLGLWPLSLLAPYALLLGARSVMTGQSRTMRHIWFVAFVAFGLATHYLLTAMTALSFPNLFSVFWQILPTALLYPFAHRLIERFEDADVRFR